MPCEAFMGSMEGQGFSQYIGEHTPHKRITVNYIDVYDRLFKVFFWVFFIRKARFMHFSRPIDFA